MNTLIVNSGGGFCNRLNGLINGVYLSALLNCKLKVHWKPNNRCDCSFSDLFSGKFEEIDAATAAKTRLILKHDARRHKFRNKKVLFISQLEEVSKVASILADVKEDTVQISNPLLYSGIGPEEAKNIISSLDIQSHIEEKADDFIKKNSIDRSVIGVHIRGTDFRNKDMNSYINAIRDGLRGDESKRYFVCSDEQKFERKLKQLFPGNIIIHNKGKAYVQRKGLNAFKPWHTNRLWRSGESVESAIVDLYILANTDLKYFRPRSTFAQTALILGDKRSWARWHTIRIGRESHQFGG